MLDDLAMMAAGAEHEATAQRRRHANTEMADKAAAEERVPPPEGTSPDPADDTPPGRPAHRGQGSPHHDGQDDESGQH